MIIMRKNLQKHQGNTFTKYMLITTINDTNLLPYLWQISIGLRFIYNFVHVNRIHLYNLSKHKKVATFF